MDILYLNRKISFRSFLAVLVVLPYDRLKSAKPEYIIGGSDCFCETGAVSKELCSSLASEKNTNEDDVELLSGVLS